MKNEEEKSCRSTLLASIDDDEDCIEKGPWINIWTITIDILCKNKNVEAFSQ